MDSSKRVSEETRLEMEAPEDTVTWWVTMGSGVKLMPVTPLQLFDLGHAYLI